LKLSSHNVLSGDAIEISTVGIPLFIIGRDEKSTLGLSFSITSIRVFSLV
jgi:hypothetical protein